MVYIRRNRVDPIPAVVCYMPQKEKESLDFTENLQ